MEMAIYELAEMHHEYDVERLRARLSTADIVKWRGYRRYKAALDSQALAKLRMKHG